MQLKVAGMLDCSVTDGPGVRAVVFTQGCPHGCPGCHNPQTHDPNGGQWLDVWELAAKLCRHKGLRGVTFSGGEPFLQARALAGLAAALKAKGLNIMIYTGYTYEELAQRATGDAAVAALLAVGDVLIDGVYVQEERDLALAYRGSRNQRIIDLPATISSGNVVLSPMHYFGLVQVYA